MSVKITLQIELEEFSTTKSLGMDYYCRVTATADGVKKTEVFNDPIQALEYARKLSVSWVHVFNKLKNNTKTKLQKQKVANQRHTKPKLIIP